MIQIELPLGHVQNRLFDYTIAAGNSEQTNTVANYDKIIQIDNVVYCRIRMKYIQIKSSTIFVFLKLITRLLLSQIYVMCIWCAAIEAVIHWK